MSQDMIVQIFREVIKMTLLLMAPALLVSILVGLVVSIFQAATQIHEMTLVFVPKILAIALSLMVLFPWMLNMAITYTTNLFNNIPNYVR